MIVVLKIWSIKHTILLFNINMLPKGKNVTFSLTANILSWILLKTVLLLNK